MAMKVAQIDRAQMGRRCCNPMLLILNDKFRLYLALKAIVKPGPV